MPTPNKRAWSSRTRPSKKVSGPGVKATGQRAHTEIQIGGKQDGPLLKFSTEKLAGAVVPGRSSP